MSSLNWFACEICDKFKFYLAVKMMNVKKRIFPIPF
jgi:hypothetical protein